VVCAVGAVIMNWTVVSTFAHFSQINTALGL
jgi:hypothetical protein